MNRFASAILVLSVAALAVSCSRKSDSAPLKPTAFGAAIAESSGGKQLAQTGTSLPQPVVVQVNDEQGTAVPGALVEFAAAPGVSFDPDSALTDSSGQVTTNVSLGGMAGRYQVTASTTDKSHKTIELKIEEIALGYQQTLGRRLNDQYCDRCHNDLTAIISYGGPALNKSALMPAWGNTLKKSDVQALITYIRAVSDPPSRNAGAVYTKN